MTSETTSSDDIDDPNKSHKPMTIGEIINLISKATEKNETNKKLQLELDKENNKYRAEYQKREKELEDTFAKKEEQLLERERNHARDVDEFQKRIKRQEEILNNQRIRLSEEVDIFNKDKNSYLARYEEKIKEVEAEKKANRELLNESIKKVEAESAQSRKELNEKIVRSSQTYITEAIRELKSKERKYQIFSIICSSLGGIALAGALAYFIDLAYKSAQAIPDKMTWEIVVFLTLKGFISISLLAGFSRYAYILSNTYLKEALKIADRMHAISFGKFYLDSYGSTHEWEQVKEVFENWNINSTSTTSSTKADDIDLVSLDKATTIFERIAKIIPSMTGKADKN